MHSKLFLCGCVSVLLAGTVWAQQEGANPGGEDAAAVDNSVAIQALVRLTHDQEPAVRGSAFAALAQIGEETPEVIAAVTAGLQDDDIAVRHQAFNTLVRAVEDGKVKVDGLLVAIQDDDPELAHAASLQLGRLGKASVPHLTDALQNERLRPLIVSTLGSIGADARDAVPALTELLKEGDAALRNSVAQCLGQICGEPRQARSASFSRGRQPIDADSIQRYLDAVLARYDTNSDGKLSRDELAGNRSSLIDGADVDGDGVITRSELGNHFVDRMRNRGGQGGFGGGPRGVSTPPGAFPGGGGAPMR